MKSILWWLLFIVGVAGAIYAIPQLLKSTLNAENPTLTVISQSMYPLLQRGDMIIVKGATREEIEVGTVIVFRHEQGMAVHRVVRLEGETITTKGDANTAEDEPITYDAVVGRVPTIGDGLLKVPLIGKVSLLAGLQPEEGGAAETNPVKQLVRYVWNPLGFSLLILLPAFLFMSSLAGDAVIALSPDRRRKRLRKKRAERLKKRWPKARIA